MTRASRVPVAVFGVHRKRSLYTANGFHTSGSMHRARVLKKVTCRRPAAGGLLRFVTPCCSRAPLSDSYCCAHHARQLEGSNLKSAVDCSCAVVRADPAHCAALNNTLRVYNTYTLPASLSNWQLASFIRVAPGSRPCHACGTNDEL